MHDSFEHDLSDLLGSGTDASCVISDLCGVDSNVSTCHVSIIYTSVQRDDSGLTMETPARCLELTPRQTVMIHGWFNPLRVLTWGHIVNNCSLNVKTLMDAGLSVDQVYYLQPDVHQWIAFKSVALVDVPHMTRWPLHPVMHLQATLGDLFLQKYNSSVFLANGITYNYLHETLGMQGAHMPLMGLDLREWIRLGFNKSDALKLSDSICMQLFQVNKADLLTSIDLVKEWHNQTK